MRARHGGRKFSRKVLAAALGTALCAQGSFASDLASHSPWSDYQIIIWPEETPAAYATLRALGVTAGVVETTRATGLFSTDALDRLQRAHLGFYIENIATDFYSPYHRYYEGKPPDWLYQSLKDRYRRDRADRSVFLRDPSLSDPAWLARIGDRLTADVHALGSRRPLFYNLADEPGIADLAVNWDFDLSPVSIEGMRSWLKGEYGSLAALNTEWNTQFSSWDDVTPETTDDAMRGPHVNFAAWGDFRAWMEVAFARAIAAGTSALHAADPQALSAIEGAQIPGMGGWNYSRLAGTVDVMELYDYGDNVELVRSLAPATIMLTTSFRSGPAEEHRVWRELLRGTRGLVLWDDADEFTTADGTLGLRGREAGPYFAELRGGLGALLIASERQLAPIAILYSPASLRLQWMLDRLPEGPTWIERNSSDEYASNSIRAATSTALRESEHMGLQPVFLSSQQLENGALLSGGFRLLVLPHSPALSPKEAAEIHRFIARGGSALADGVSGIYDQHGRKLPQPLLADIFPHPSPPLTGEAVAGAIQAAGLESNFLTERINDGGRPKDIETYIFHNGDATILAFLRDLPANQAALAENESIMVSLPRPAYVYDLRTGHGLGQQKQLVLPVSPIDPTIIALADHPLPPPVLTGPSHISRGSDARFHVTAATAADVLHVEVTDPAGRPVAGYPRNLTATNAGADFDLSFAANDPLGTWTITARDIMSGHGATIQTALTDR